jgi:dipeptidase
MIEDIKLKQQEIEGKEFAYLPAIDAAALVLHEKDPELARAYLTDYSVNNANTVVQEWRELGKFLVAKYIDGYVNKPTVGEGVGYPLWWLKEVGFGPLPTEKP